MAKAKVQKGLTPEEKTIVENLKAMIAQLEGAGAGDAAGMMGEDQDVSAALKAIEGMAGTAPNEELDAGATPTRPPKSVMGKVVPVGKSNSGQGSTDTDVPEARDSAEDRIEELPDQDDENVKEVAKTMMTVIQKMLSSRRRVVGKSADGQDLVTTVANAVAKLAEEVSVVKTAQVKILEGLGIVDRIAEAERVEKADERRPVGTYDHDQVTELVAKSLAEALRKVGVEKKEEDSLAAVRKDMSGVLSILGRNTLWNPGM